MMKRLSYLVLLAFLLPAIAACSDSSSDDSADKDQTTQDDADKKAEKDKKEEAEKKKEADKKKPLPICPQVAIVRELDTLRDYGAEKPDPSELVGVARMQSVEGDCAYPDDGGIDIAFDLKMIAQRGPRLGGNRSNFPFFIAIVDPDQNIVDKQKLTTEFKFSDDPKKVADKTESLHVVVPLAKDKREAGPNYQVLVGFQLTQEQLDAVRAKESQDPKAPKPLD